jgi:hypothetical protein
MALTASLQQGSKPQKMLGFLGIDKKGLNDTNPITANLNQVRMLYAGVLEKTDIADANEISLTRIPIVSTSSRGNSWTVQNQYELMMPNPEKQLREFIEGVEPVNMGYFVSGKFKSAFPNGIDIKDPNDANAPARHLEGICLVLTILWGSVVRFAF